MTFEMDAVQVKSFALVPIDTIPDVIDGSQNWKLVVLSKHTNTQAAIVFDGGQMSDGRKPLAGPTRIAGVINTREINRLLKGEQRIIA